MAKKKQGEASSSTTSPNTFQNKPKFKLLKEQIKQQKVTQKLNKSAAATTTSGSSGKKSTSSVNKTSSIQIPILEISDKNLTDASPSSEEEQVENIDENIRLDLSLQCGSKSEYEFVCKTCGGEHDEEKCTNNYCPNCLEKHKLENCPHAKAGANVCEWCNKKGHTQVKCPMKQYIISKDDIPENVICFVCGEKGHLVCFHVLHVMNFKSCNCSNNYMITIMAVKLYSNELCECMISSELLHIIQVILK